MKKKNYINFKLNLIFVLLIIIIFASIYFVYLDSVFWTDYLNLDCNIFWDRSCYGTGLNVTNG